MNNHESPRNFTPNQETKKTAIEVESIEIKTEKPTQDIPLEERKKQQAQKDTDRIHEVEKDLGINQESLSLGDFNTETISPRVKNFLFKLGKEKTVQLLTSLDKRDIQVLRIWLAKGPDDGLGDMALAALNTYRSRMEGYPIELITAAQQSNNPEIRQRAMDAERVFTDWTKGL